MPHVNEDDIGAELRGPPDGALAVAHLPDHLDVVGGVEYGPQAQTGDGLLIRDENTDPHWAHLMCKAP
ncbi:hypothetical protein GCM10009800_51730 [Nocardiopsis rhodophaea]